MLLLVAALIIMFSVAVYRISAAHRHGALGPISAGFMAVSTAGIGLCPFPHPFHNLFGTSELVAYQAPLVFALQWRKAAKLVRFSWICFAALWVSIAINFVVFFRDSPEWQAVKPIYGLIERSLFLACCCAV